MAVSCGYVKYNNSYRFEETWSDEGRRHIVLREGI